MKKISILLLVVLFGFGLCFSEAQADPTRTIPMKTGVALHTNTLITGNGGVLYKVVGRATSAAASYIIYDYATVAEALGGGASNSGSNILTEGGEATQYDPISLLDFGDEGIRFRSGLVIVTSTADVVVHYR